MTLGLAGNPMVAIGFRMASLVPSTTGRLSAHNICETHREQVKSKSWCESCAAKSKTNDGSCTHVSAYEHEGKWVLKDDLPELEAERDAKLTLDAIVEPGSIDPLFFEKAYALWPEAGQEQAFDLFASAIRASGKYAVGTSVQNKATKAVVVRWSAQAGCLLAHLCAFGPRIAWGDLQQIEAGIAARDQVDEAKAVEAFSLFAQMLDESFDLAEIEDAYADQLETAVANLAAGIEAPEKEPEAASAPVLDLMDALRASVATVAAPKKKAKPRVKAAA
jgi:DNA end-binding protein Ku